MYNISEEVEEKEEEIINRKRSKAICLNNFSELESLVGKRKNMENRYEL